MALIRAALVEKQKQLDDKDNLSRAHDAERRILHKKVQKFNDHLDVPLLFVNSPETKGKMKRQSMAPHKSGF